jgi:type I restriction enzyme S subunit
MCRAKARVAAPAKALTLAITETLRFGDLVKVVQRPMRMADDGEYDLMTVKRSRGGIASRGRFRGRDISVKSQFYLEAGDFLISRRQIVHGACAVVPEEFSGSIVSNEYAVLRCKPGLDLGFLKYLSHSVYFQQTCFHASIGVHVEKMIFKLEDWLKFRVNVPPLEEQKRIAAGFEAVDAKLVALREKADGLRQFKTGLMQRLFSQELRFTREDGSNFPEWDLVPFKDVFIRTKSKNDRGLKNVLTISARHGLVSQEDFFNKSVASENLNNYYHVKRGEFAYNKSYSKYYPMGAIKRLTLYDEGVVSPLYICFAAKDEAAASFFEHYFESGMLNAEISRIAQEGARNHGLLNVSVVDFFNQISVFLPTPEEQHKIADTLSALDAKIDAVTDQITHMETFKKGLLQKMFV